MRQSPKYFTILPNTESSKEIIKFIRFVAKVNDWKVTLRGRHKDRKSLANKYASSLKVSPSILHTAFRRDVPLKYAERIAVYIKKQHPDDSDTYNSSFIQINKLSK